MHYLLQFFDYDHLHDDLKAVAMPFSALAYDLLNHLPNNSERTVALRELLGAKDAAMRSYLMNR